MGRGRKPKKANIVFVNISNYKGAKKVIKYFQNSNVYKASSAYRRKRIRDFNARLKPNMKTKEKQKLVADFMRYMGVNKDGTINPARKKTSLKYEGGNNFMAQIKEKRRPKKAQGKISDTSLSWAQSWVYIKDALKMFNAVAYFEDFASEIYPDWVERARLTCAQADERIYGMDGRQFVLLCIELKNRFGW